MEKWLERNFFKSLVLTLIVGTSASSVMAEDVGLALHGFGDAGGGFSSHETPAEQKVKGFKIGTVDFYLNPEFEDKVKSLIEIAFEPNHGNGSIGMDVERLQVGYTVSNYLTLWVGRFHTPFGYWNNAFHHGSQLQTSVYRPKFLDFEDSGGILPDHTVGLWGKGGVKLDTDKINYNVYVGNGSRIIFDNNTTNPGTLDMNNFRNDKNHYMIGVSLSYAVQNGLFDGLELGGHGFSTDINSYTADDYSVSATNSTRVNMTGGFFHYDNHNFEIIAEYYGFSNKNLKVAGATSVKSNAEFAQLGYSIQELFTPYVRVEKSSLSDHDNYFTDQKSGKSYTRYSVGFKKDINPKAAFKAEFARTTKDGTNPKYNLFQYSYAIRF